MNLHTKMTFLSIALILVALPALDATSKRKKRNRAVESPAAGQEATIRSTLQAALLDPISRQVDAVLERLGDGAEKIGESVGRGAARAAAAEKLTQNRLALSQAAEDTIERGVNQALASLEEILSPIASHITTAIAPQSETVVEVAADTSDAPHPMRRQRVAAEKTEAEIAEELDEIKRAICLPAAFTLNRSGTDVTNVLRGLDDAARTIIATYILKHGISSCGGTYELTPELALRACYGHASEPNTKLNLLVYYMLPPVDAEPVGMLRKAARTITAVASRIKGEPSPLAQAIRTDDVVAVFNQGVNHTEAFCAEVATHDLDFMNDATQTMQHLVDALFAYTSTALPEK